MAACHSTPIHCPRGNAVAMMDLFELLDMRHEQPAARRRTAWLQAFPDPARRRGADAAIWRQRQPRRAHLGQVLPAYEALLRDHDYR